ncbi:MAG: hypothetical protein WC650_04260 [Candidatus Doudnabacteria bacterium]
MIKEVIPTEINPGDRVKITKEDELWEKRVVVGIIQISKEEYRFIMAGDVGKVGIFNLTYRDKKWQYTDSGGLQTTVKINYINEEG